MSAPVALIDACPVCDPLDRAAGKTVAVQAANGGTLTAHECGWCGSSWRTFRDFWGWPVERRLDPVSPQQAEANRIALAIALEGTWGGHHHAAA